MHRPDDYRVARACPECGAKVWKWKDDAFCPGFNGCTFTCSHEEYDRLDEHRPSFGYHSVH